MFFLEKLHLGLRTPQDLLGSALTCSGAFPSTPQHLPSPTGNTWGGVPKQGLFGAMRVLTQGRTEVVTLSEDPRPAQSASATLACGLGQSPPSLGAHLADEALG